MVLPAWWRQAIPHQDVLKGELTEEKFAADLWGVVREWKQTPQEYRDAQLFFERTYPTDGLVTFLADVVKRLVKGVGNSVITLQTPFGGGKTHTLIALYHLLQSGHQLTHVDLVQRVMKEVGVEALPETDVAVFVGDKVDPMPAEPPFTPLGILMKQLGKYDAVERHDKEWASPGGERLQELLSGKPTVLLLDELVTYGVELHRRWRAVEDERVELEAQVNVFWQQLTETVRNLPHCVLIATLPTSAPYGEVAGPAVLNRLQQIFGRMEKVYVPVKGIEIYEVVRRRLFERLGDEELHRQVAREYFDLYQRCGNRVPSVVREVAYRDRIARAYPFHPLLIDLLRERWGTMEGFQRTRGVLRLLAMVVRELHEQRTPEPLIHPTHVDLSGSVRGELLKLVGQEYDGVLTADVVGETSHAAQVDGELGDEFRPLRIGTGLATTIFLSSFHGAQREEGEEEVVGTRRGLERTWLRVAVLHEDTKDAPIDEALTQLQRRSWYLDQKGDLLFFGLEPSLEKIIREYEERVSDEDVEKALRDQLETALKANTFKPYLFPEGSHDIPDGEELKLVVLSTRYLHGEEITASFVKELLERRGETPRMYPNTVFVAAATRQGLDELRFGGDGLKRFVAMQRVERERKPTLPLRKQQELDEKLKECQQGLPKKVLEAFRWVAYLTKDGLKWDDLGMVTVGEVSLQQRVKNFLSSNAVGKLITTVTPNRLVRKDVFGKERSQKVQDLRLAFARYRHLPAVTSPEVVREAIRRGVREGVFALQIDERIEVLTELTDVPDEAKVVRWLEVGELTPQHILRLLGYDRRKSVQELEDKLKNLVRDKAVLEAALKKGEEQGLFQVRRNFVEKMEAPPLPKKLTSNDLLAVIGDAREITVRIVYDEVYRRRGNEFDSKEEFALEFWQALEALRKEGWQLTVDEKPLEVVVREGEIGAAVLERGILRRQPPLPPPLPTGFRYKFQVSWDKLGQLGQTVTRLVRANPELQEKLTITVILSSDISLPDDWRKLLEEALKQLGWSEEGGNHYEHETTREYF